MSLCVAAALAAVLSPLPQDVPSGRQEPAPVRMLGEPVRHHANVVRSVELAPDGKRCVTASWDGTAAIWDLARTTPIRILEAGSGMATFACFARDGEIVIAGAGDKSLHAWSAANGDELARTDSPFPHATGAVSPDGKLLATQPAGDGQDVELRDVATLEVKERISWKGALLFEVAWSPDSRYVALGSALPSRVVVFDRETKTIVSDLAVSKHLSGLAVRPDGKAIGLLVFPDLLVHSFPDLGSTPIATCRGSSEAMHDFAWRDDRSVIVADSEGAILCIDVESAKVVWGVTEHRDAVYDVDLSHDGKLVASASGDGTVRFWSTADGVEQHRPSGNRDMVLCLAWNQDGTTLAAGDYGNVVARYDVASGAVRSELVHELAIAALAILDDGSTLSLSHAQQFQTMPAGAAPATALVDCADRKELPSIAAAAFSGERALVLGADSMLRAFSRVDGTLIDEVSIHVERGIDLALSLDGTRIVTAAHDGTVRLSLAEGRELAVLGEELEGIEHLAFLGNDRAAALDATGALRIWTLGDDPKLAASVPSLSGGDGEQFLDLCATQDGRHLAVLGANRLWLLAGDDGRTLGSTTNYTSIPRCGAFTRDGKRLATGMVDGTVLLWDVATLLAK
ncbi:MAG: WD40 repeat domain-containing protein [Planctomycetes bacterium]|nr:WD40 repeat domain-containing protein [Planctomycetota bacterium]